MADSGESLKVHGSFVSDPNLNALSHPEHRRIIAKFAGTNGDELSGIPVVNVQVPLPEEPLKVGVPLRRVKL